jgi:hypothetical protein
LNRTVLIAFLLAAACSPEAATQPWNQTNEAQQEFVPTAQAPLSPPAPGQPDGLPDDRTPIAEGPIDAKSAEGAAQVLQKYFALLEAGKRGETDALWSDSGTPADFGTRLARYREVHANIGAPGELGGAAGSIYVDVPVQLYGRLLDGKEFHARGTMTLRRVNDVPGSTGEQRKWHIYRADFPKDSAST